MNSKQDDIPADLLVNLLFHLLLYCLVVRFLFYGFYENMKHFCKACERNISKSALALRCAHCEGWTHVGCGGVEEEDLAFMKRREKCSFRWFCGQCLERADEIKGVITDRISGVLISIDKHD